MKICMISMTNPFLCPYINKYLKSIPENIEIDLIYWDRHGVEESNAAFNNIYIFNRSQDERAKKIGKVKNIFRFARYVESKVKCNHYDRLVLLHNYMAIAILRLLLTKYKRKYLIDIRDYSFEKNRLFYTLEKTAIKHSGLAVISSKGFLNFLPDWDYVVCHNDPLIDYEMIKKITSKERDETQPIRIAFIGLVRFYDQNKKLMDLLGNDPRFILAYYGQNSEPLEQYALKKNITNTEFIGRFDPSETTELYERTDIINNYYGNHTPVLDYALSNKLYYAATFRKPILVCEDTYMHEIATHYGFGLTISENEEAADKLYEAYMKIDRKAMDRSSDVFLTQIQKDNEEFFDCIHSFLDIKYPGKSL